MRRCCFSQGERDAVLSAPHQRGSRIAAGADPATIVEACWAHVFARAFHDNMFAELPRAEADRKFLRTLIRALIG